MFLLESISVLAEQENKYLSFPDIVASNKDKNKYFAVYRSGNEHHPSASALHILLSNDCCKTWAETDKLELDISTNGYVWNCPRLCVFNNDIHLVVDAKSSQSEGSAKFVVVQSLVSEKGKIIFPKIMFHQGMVPDKVVKFKDRLFCANHFTLLDKITLSDGEINNKLKTRYVQAINWSDNGLTWYNRSVIQQENKNLFCEASIVNCADKFLLAFVRNNKSRMEHIARFRSYNGINWERIEDIQYFGHRMVAFCDKKEIFGVFRDTKKLGLALYHSKLELNINEEFHREVFYVEMEKQENLYNFGYAGLVRLNKDLFYVVYYIQQDRKNPVIKGAFVNYYD